MASLCFRFVVKKCIVGLFRSILCGKIALALQHSLLSHTPLCIWMISGVCVQGMWNAHIKGQVTETHRLKFNGHCDTTLFISVYDITMAQPQQPLVATIVITSSELGNNSNRLFHQVSSFHMVNTSCSRYVISWACETKGICVDFCNHSEFGRCPGNPSAMPCIKCQSRNPQSHNFEISRNLMMFIIYWSAPCQYRPSANLQ